MKYRFFIYTAMAVVLFSCTEKKADYAAMSTNDVAISADTTAIAKIIKTADMRFRVKDVLKAKAGISKIIRDKSGTITEVATNSYVQKTEKVRCSADSLQEITSYSTEGVITAKIPSEKLDDFTNEIAALALFVDNQSLKMDDQGIAYLENRLKANNRKEALDKVNKLALKKGTNVETSLYLKDDYIDKQMENTRIDNSVKFSTITLNFYQGNTVKTIITGNDNLSDYRPGFLRRLGLNFVDGWNIFKEFLLLLSNLWMFIALAIAGYFAFRYYRKRRP